MKHKEKRISAFTVAATYVGTVVGAGFATGQEILQFFGFYGLRGLWGLILSGFLFAFYGGIILQLGLKLNADSHLKVIQETGGKWVGTLVDWVITFFLFGALVVMAAGAGAIFDEQFGLSPLLGNGLMMVLALLTVLAGITGVITAISLVAPLLLASVLGIGIYSLVNIGFNPDALQWSAPARAAIPFWPLAALLYVSYNLVLSVAVLAPLGKAAKDPKVLAKGALWGGIGLSLGALAISLAIIANSPEATRFDVPMAFIAGSFAPIFGTLYTGVLFLEIFTTAVGSLYGFISRLVAKDNPRLKLYAAVTAGSAFFAGQVGLTALVRTLFPLVGYAGLFMLAGLTWSFLKPKFKINPVPVPALKPLSENHKPNENKIKEEKSQPK